MFDKDSFSLSSFLFLSIVSAVTTSSYILIRELLYKLIHYLGYRAQPDLKVIRMRRGLDISFPVFEKYGQDYKVTVYEAFQEASNRVFADMFRIL